ncbi:MAG TPA: YCF48-related protein, partial [Bacteroidota bacterium]|nr:YCF48-related protein [Bacteroidota bacterium]
TTNGGATWSKQTIASGNDINDLEDVGGALIIVGQNGIIQQSNDGGNTWNSLDSGQRLSVNWIDFSSAAAGVAVGQAGLIMSTTNGGTSWNAQTSPVPSVSCYGVKSTDATHAWAVGDNGTIIRTTDGGTWTTESCPVTHTLFGINFNGSQNGWIVGGEFSGYTGVILNSTDGGNSWHVQYNGVPNILYGVSFPTASIGWAVGENGTILHTRNGGATWSSQASGFSGAMYWCAFSDTMNGWACGDNGNILHTTNGGAAWTVTKTAANGFLYGIATPGPKEAIAVGDTGVILHTYDGGATWNVQYSRTVLSLFSVSANSSSQLFVGGDYGTVLTYTNLASDTGSISGNVFFDANQNGAFDSGEPGLGGWTISLTGGETLSVQSGSDGSYTFGGLPFGTYSVSITPQASWTQTTAATYSTTLYSGNPSANSRNFGEYIPNGSVFSIAKGWNLLSLPVVTSDPRVTTVFPNASSGAYVYSNGYLAVDTVLPGPGFWLKFPATQTVVISGTVQHADTITVQAGWNMIGSVGGSVSTSAMTSEPGGIIVGNIFDFAGSYHAVTEIAPGKGYWIKVNQAGKIILTAGQ